MHTLDDSLPRLLYIADLPVAPTQAGAILLYRLLEQWPADKLMVCTPFARTDCPLPGVRKIEPPRAPLSRLFYSRVAYEWMTTLTLFGMLKRRLRGGRPARWLARAVAEFSPEAVLTVGLAGAWMEADSVSREAGIPLHVIIHDDHHYARFWIPGLRPWGEKLFGETYRRATSRLCISRPMERAYRERFGCEGQVLLPSRGRASVSFDAPRSGGFAQSGQLKVFYAGSVYGKVFEELKLLAGVLAAGGHRLILYTPSNLPPGFEPGHLEIRAPLSSSELVRQLHEEADLLLLLTSFEPGLMEVIRTQFPSKMVDYTAAAVPILVVAPEQSGIADYLREWPTAAQLVCDPAPDGVRAAVDSLAADPEGMLALACGAAQAGQDDFGYETSYLKFCGAMVKGVRG